jgi:hypothetical protein
LLTGSFTGLTWNGVGPGEARKRLLRTARIDGNVDHPSALSNLMPPLTLAVPQHLSIRYT